MNNIREINLTAKVTELLLELKGLLKEPQEKIQIINTRINDLLTGICLNEGVDLNTASISVNPELTQLIITSKETPEAQDVPDTLSEKKPLSKKAAVKKQI